MAKLFDYKENECERERERERTENCINDVHMHSRVTVYANFNLGAVFFFVYNI